MLFGRAAMRASPRNALVDTGRFNIALILSGRVHRLTGFDGSRNCHANVLQRLSDCLGSLIVRTLNSTRRVSVFRRDVTDAR